MVGELVGSRHAETARGACPIDDVDGSELRFLATVAREIRDGQGSTVAAEDGAGAFIKPFGSDAGFVGRGTAALDAELVHTHTVGDCRGGVHSVPIRGAGEMRKAGAGDEAARGL